MATKRSQLDNKINNIIRCAVSNGLSNITTNVHVLKAFDAAMDNELKAAWLSIVKEVQQYDNEVWREHQIELGKKTNTSHDAAIAMHNEFVRELCVYFDVGSTERSTMSHEQLLNKIKANVTAEFDRVSSRNTAARTDANFSVKNIRRWQQRWSKDSPLLANDEFKYALMMQECVELRYELQRVMQKYQVPYHPTTDIQTTTMRLLDFVYARSNPATQLTQEEHDLHCMRLKNIEIEELRTRINQIEHLYNPPAEVPRQKRPMGPKATVPEMASQSLDDVISTWIAQLAAGQDLPKLSKEEILKKIVGIFDIPKK